MNITNLPEEILELIISQSKTELYNISHFKSHNRIKYEKMYLITYTNKYFYNTFGNVYSGDNDKFYWNWKYYKKYFN